MEQEVLFLDFYVLVDKMWTQSKRIWVAKGIKNWWLR